MSRLLLASCSIALACGCGGTQIAEDDAPDAAMMPPRTEDDGPPLGSTLGGAEEEASSSGSSGKPANPKPGALGHGFVAVRTVSGEGTTAIARFFDEPDPGDGLGPDGCRVDARPDPATVPDIGVSAGDVSITVGEAAARLEFRPNDGGYNEVPIALTTEPFSLATTMGASALGATVPGFIGFMLPVPEPAFVTSPATGIADGPFDVSWGSIPNAKKITVELEGAAKIVTCSVKTSATHLVVPQARVAEVIAMPAVLDGCASCLKLTLTGSSEVMIDAGGYTISLRHESSVSAALAVH